jgi:phosphoglycolate phosphatase-like HAD superfamily hydrolase
MLRAAMRFELLVLDFDGTFTDVEKEAIPFLAAYRADLEARLGAEAVEGWDEVATHIGESPERFGWEFEGRIVAPSHADPYVMATSTAQKILDDHGLVTDPAERRRFLEEVFRANYAKASSVFRPEAREVAEALLATGAPVYVVTNSSTDAVHVKLDALAPRGRERLTVIGDAKKYVIADPGAPDPSFDALPETRALSGLERPIYLRRGLYFEALAAALAAAGATPDRALVCGDIYELDLAMPAELGFHVHLVARPGTPSYEREAVAAHPRGAVSETLDAVLARLNDG